MKITKKILFHPLSLHARHMVYKISIFNGLYTFASNPIEVKYTFPKLNN